MLALVWKRSDVRESSRLVTLLTRERGRVVALAKGAHRPGSVLLGRIDFLNRVDVTFAGRGMPLLGKAALVHEPRALRRSPRFETAAHLCQTLDHAWLADHPDPELFDLTLGMITLVERAPLESLGVVVAGVELRLLRHLGSFAGAEHCASCGATIDQGPLWAGPSEGGLGCEQHRPERSRRVHPDALRWLGTLDTTAGRDWPRLRPGPQHGEVLALLGNWLGTALEHRLPLRPLCLTSLAVSL